MKSDRYKENQTLFIIGIACLVLCLGFLFFGFYILPFLFWDTNYGVPYFVSDMIAYFEDAFLYTSFGAKFIVAMIFLIPGLIFGIASYFISNYIEGQIYQEKAPTEEAQNKDSDAVRRELKASAGMGFKIFILMAVVVVVLIFLQSMLFGK